MKGLVVNVGMVLGLWLGLAGCAEPTADMPGGGGLATTPLPATPEAAPTEAPTVAPTPAAAPATDPAAAGAGGPVMSLTTPGGEGLTPIRIGWQTTWATQGQLVAVFLHTDILQKNGFVADLQGFPYGGPLNEGALAGAVDVLFTADQPALSLAAKAPSWGIIGRLMYNRVGLFVPPKSTVMAPKDLKGGTVAVPFGAAAQREAMAAVQAAGLDPKQDVKFVNLGVEEILGAVRGGERDGHWGELSAAAAWDPTLAEVEHSGRGRTISTATVTSVVVMNDAFVKANPGADARFMNALAAAYEVYRQDPARADVWFQQAAKLKFNLSVLTVAASVEPNLSAKGPDGIRVHLEPKDVAGITAAEAFMEKAGLLKAPLDVKTVLRAQATTAAAVPDATAVTIRP